MRSCYTGLKWHVLLTCAIWPWFIGLSERGTLLHTETALTRRWQPLWGALHGFFSGGEDITYVYRNGYREGAGFLQLRISEDNLRAQLVYLGATTAREKHEPQGDRDHLGQPAGDLDETVWLALLDGAVVDIGQRGVHSLVAEVDETGPELVMLRRAGFVVYTRQDVWVLDTPPDQSDEQELLIPYRPDDDWEMALLYAHIVPPLIQMVEPTPPEHGVTWVLRESDHELAAFVHVHDGPDAAWVHFFIHPNAQTATTDIVAAAVHVAAPRADHPVYCCVRRYQSWLQTGLEQNGFQSWASQAVMVKHTVHPVRQKQQVQSTLVPAQGSDHAAGAIFAGPRASNGLPGKRHVESGPKSNGAKGVLPLMVEVHAYFLSN